MVNESQQKPSLIKQQSVGILAIAFAIIAILFSALAWQQYSTVRDDMGDRTTQLQQALSQLKIEVQQYQSRSQATLSANEKNIAAILNQLNDAQLQPVLTEVGYLIRLANLHLTIENNVSQAIQLFKMAEQRLLPLTTSALNPLKQALNHDVSALSAMPTINVTDLIDQIDQLNTQIANIEILMPNITHTSNPVSIDVPSYSWWDKVKHNIGGLKDLFIVRHIEEPIAAPPPSLQQFTMIKENIRLKLSQAQWALLSLQKPVYQQSLHTAARWLSEINQNQPTTDELIKKLEALAVIDIKPSLPPLQSLQALQSIPDNLKKTESTSP